MSEMFVSNTIGAMDTTYIDKVSLISHVQIMYHRGFVQVGEFSHIAGLIEFSRIYFVHCVDIDFALLIYPV